MRCKSALQDLVASLQVESGAQSHHNDLLRAQLDLLATMNTGAQEAIKDMERFIKEIKPSDCGHSHLPKSAKIP